MAVQGATVAPPAWSGLAPPAWSGLGWSGVAVAVLVAWGCSAATPAPDQPELLARAEAAGDALERCAGGSPLACDMGVVQTEKVIDADPESYAARRAVELLFQHREALARSGVLVSDELLDMYERHKDSLLAGHFLFYSALSLSDNGPSQASLYLLMLLVDHHSASPLWDDGVVHAADLLSALGRHGDEALLLEEALTPRPGRGSDALADAFCQRLRIRLAGLYERQGRYDEALYQLELSLNYHPVESLKDDALWSIAQIYRTQGDRDREARALAFLLDSCPWSRHAARARERLGR